MSTSLEIVLRGGVDAAFMARRALDASAPALPTAVHDDVSLLVTELVTNAVLHGGAAEDKSLRVAFRRQADRIHVEVIDPGTDFHSPGRPGSGDSTGWGLFLVDRIAATWGVRPAPVGTCVWFEMVDAVPP